ncbi:WLM domain-containing protein, partial [Macrophomina phaseolina MS6]
MASTAEPQHASPDTPPNESTTAFDDVTMSAGEPQPSLSPQTSDSADDTNTLSVTLTHHGSKHTLHLAPSATLSDLSAAIADVLSIPPTHQKLLITPKPGLVKPPFRDPALALAPLLSPRTKIVLMGSTPAEVSALQTSVAHASSQQRARESRRYAVAQPATPARTAGSARASADAQYTFHTLRPLPHLPCPERSLALLERLRDDAGVRAAMRAHRFSVGLLTEMDPAMHTTHESRTLGLNRNRGEVIELRLRTDAYDGYRDYKTIRRTLCHELAHNVWGEHDRNFWDLCRQIEREVERGDWRAGGRRVGGVAGDEV